MLCCCIEYISYTVLITMPCSKSTVFLSLIAVAVSNDVLELSGQSEFTTETSSGYSLVEFYAPWCGHCQKLQPAWEKAATALKDTAKMIKVDCTTEENKELCEEYGIRGYPTIMVFHDGVSSMYKGGRSAEELIAFEHAPAIAILKPDELTAVKKDADKDMAVVGFFPEGHDNIKKLGHLSHIFDKQHSFYIIHDIQIAKQEGLSGPGVVLYKPFDEKKNLFEVGDELFKSSAVRDFIATESFKLFTEMTSENYKSFEARKLPVGWLFTNGPEDADTKSAMELLSLNAHITKNKMSLVWMDGTVYPEMAQRIGLKGKKFPSFAIENLKSETNHQFTTEGGTLDGVVEFIEQYLVDGEK